jgi:hypothetical protein
MATGHNAQTGPAPNARTPNEKIWPQADLRLSGYYAAKRTLISTSSI